VNQKIYLILFICLLSITGCSEEKQPKTHEIRPVKVFHISGPEEVVQRSFPGKVDASSKADLAFLVPGKIIEFPVKEGQKVEKGQLIAKLDPRDFEIAVEEAKSKAEYEKAQLERKTTLVEKGFVSKSEFEAQRTASRVANTNLDTAKQNLAYATLVAPFSGEISTRYVDNFQTVKVNEPIVRLQNRDNIDIIIQVPESLAINYKQESNINVEAEFDSAPGKRFQATVKEVSSKADPDTQTYKAKLTMPAPQGLNILPGMTATVFVKFQSAAGQNTGQYMIPASAIFADEKNNSYVWVIDPKTNEIYKHLIKIGQLENESIQVTEGLSPGMDIVAAGAKFLMDGEKVRPLENTRE
jgi:RND family efflux transporter MFP subunit